MSVHEFEEHTYYLGSDHLKQRINETETLITSLNEEEAYLKARLQTVRRTRTFLSKDVKLLWRRVTKAERS